MQPAAVTLSALLQQLKCRIEDPLLPLPDPTVVRRRLFQVVPSAARRSRRIAAQKGKPASAVKRAQRMLMCKLGVCRDEEWLSAAQLEEYASIFASPLGPEQVGAIAALFGLSCAAGDLEPPVEASWSRAPLSRLGGTFLWITQTSMFWCGTREASITRPAGW
jgi:hypothetical protein